MQLDFWTALLRHWSKMLVGYSYWHSAQGLGPCFRPGELQDYYRDYSTKVKWTGAIDESKFPLVQEPGGKLFHHPIVLAQKALGHWSCWLSEKQERHCESFLQLAHWFVRAQELQGSWKIKNMEKPEFIFPYSALSQGQAISVLVRAFSVTSDNAYREAAHRGLEFMLTPLGQGGLCRPTAAGPILEEFPKRTLNAVLNGWISALYGLYDWLLLVEQANVRETLDSSLEALITYLSRFDAGYWSFYDLSGTIASPYYHNVHITQLRALELTFPRHAHALKIMRVTFQEQRSSSVSYAKAVVLKAFQKLRRPPPTLFMQGKTN